MKSLLILRHAKSSKDDLSLADFDRPLTERGEADAKLIGKYLRKQRVVPEIVISSPAKRARKTSELFVKAAHIDCTPQFDGRIYDAGVYRLLQVVSEIEDSVATALVVGHNPGFEDLLNLLTGEYQRMCTAALAHVDLSITKWFAITAGNGKLAWIMSPKDLK